jgi:hypothetical protein
MKINYIIATWSGQRINGYSDFNYYQSVLKRHIIELNKIKNSIDQITIMKPFNDIINSYYDIELNDKIKIIDCENKYQSYGQWLKAVELFLDDFDYFIFIEDDYIPGTHDFDKKLIEIDDKLTKATSGEVRRGRPINVGALQRFKKQLEDMKPNAKGGIAIIPPPMFEGLGFSYKDKEKYAPEELEEQLLRKVIRESVEKELSAINKEAESEVISTKLEKIDAAIEKRQSQLNKLDEDEDMKALTDKTKIKQAQKDIKTLEKAKAKLEKDLSKIKKKNKDAVSSDIIDEDAPIDEAIDDKKLDDTSKSLDDIGKKVEDISTKTKDMFENEGELPQNIINQAVEMFADVNGDSDEIINIASNFPEYEESVVEFLEGYDLGLDYDI